MANNLHTGRDDINRRTIERITTRAKKAVRGFSRIRETLGEGGMYQAVAHRVGLGKGKTQLSKKSSKGKGVAKAILHKVSLGKKGTKSKGKKKLMRGDERVSIWISPELFLVQGKAIF